MADTEKRNFVGPKIEYDNKTGLSHFILSTTDALSGGRPKIIQLHGLLSDLPEFSFTVNYEDGPGNEWQDILSNFMTNDLMAIFNTIGAKGAGFKNIVKAGSWTKKVYAGYAPSTIPLKFRIYTRDTFGQSSAEKWKKYLIKFASINDGNRFQIDTAAKNIFSAIQTAYNSGEAVANLANSSVSNFNNGTNVPTDKSDSDDEKYEKYMSNAMTVDAQKNAVNEALSEISKLVRPEDPYKIEMTLEYTEPESNYYALGWAGMYNPIKFSASFTDTRLASGGTVKFDPVEIGRNHSNSGIMGSELDPDGIYIHYSKLEKALNDFISKCSSLGKDAENGIKKILDNSAKLMIKKAFDTKPPHEEKNDEIHKLGRFLMNNIDALGDVMVSKYGKNRVYETMNIENSLGEKLWHLNIYNNVIFNTTKPLVVYISEWSYKASEERDGNEPVYYDFEITCALDQVYSREIWNKILARPKPATKSPTSGV